jgi:RNA polymerase sigma factor (sigma-70 family)
MTIVLDQTSDIELATEQRPHETREHQDRAPWGGWASREAPSQAADWSGAEWSVAEWSGAEWSGAEPSRAASGGVVPGRRGSRRVGLNGAALSTRIQPRSATVTELVNRAKEGDSEAWQALVDRFGRVVAATGWRYRLSGADVAELQQITWLRLVEHLQEIEQPERLGAWLATTARRESLQILRRAAKYSSGADEILANTADRYLPEPDARAIAEENEVVVRAAWKRLRPRCQELLSLLITDEPVGYQDISDLLQMAVGSIGPSRQRCLAHLRQLVKEEGMRRAGRVSR